MWWFDAQAMLAVRLTNTQVAEGLELADVALRMPVRREVASFLMGFGEPAQAGR